MSLPLRDLFLGHLYNMQSSPKKGRANAISPSSRSVLKNIHPELLHVVFNHASPQSIRSVSEANRSLRSMAKPRVRVKAKPGETVYYKPYRLGRLGWGMEFYKLGNNGELQPLQPRGTPFKYFRHAGPHYNRGRFVTPMHTGNKRVAVQNLGLNRLPSQNRWNGGHKYYAFRVLS